MSLQAFARVAPQQKELILTTSKDVGKGELWYGTNDVGALKQVTHIGIWFRCQANDAYVLYSFWIDVHMSRPMLDLPYWMIINCGRITIIFDMIWTPWLLGKWVIKIDNCVRIPYRPSSFPWEIVYTNYHYSLSRIGVWPYFTQNTILKPYHI